MKSFTVTKTNTSLRRKLKLTQNLRKKSSNVRSAQALAKREGTKMTAREASIRCITSWWSHKRRLMLKCLRCVRTSMTKRWTRWKAFLHDQAQEISRTQWVQDKSVKNYILRVFKKCPRRDLKLQLRTTQSLIIGSHLNPQSIKAARISYLGRNLKELTETSLKFSQKKNLELWRLIKEPSDSPLKAQLLKPRDQLWIKTVKNVLKTRLRDSFYKQWVKFNTTKKKELTWMGSSKCFSFFIMLEIVTRN